jgi:hypothetical protein
MQGFGIAICKNVLFFEINSIFSIFYPFISAICRGKKRGGEG